MAGHLAPHLSHKSALVLLPSSLITPPIETIRRVNDKHFARWPPHINLIYPFLPHQIKARIQNAVKAKRPFHVALSAAPPGTFSHSKRSKTVWLAPSPADAIQHLQAALQAEFSECDSDSRPFTPHLSVGQAHSDAAALKLGTEVKKIVSDHLNDGDQNPSALDWYVDKIFVIERKGYHGRFQVVDAIELQTE
ncbi:hypothetical protein K458DRAFT_478124 [Lentithecium fluviatile CBS 122367]|uniref:Uncharacterized protein n=1 Tax=Lentithecium fluviatile CBS 122367 TaxID=1168545 RepID=A0A6G1IZP9_9PLEO|nr:hypothetical protein K458DRAFT_478124 [Lentithecium fluviatile CBS 122367]